MTEVETAKKEYSHYCKDTTSARRIPAQWRRGDVGVCAMQPDQVDRETEEDTHHYNHKHDQHTEKHG